MTFFRGAQWGHGPLALLDSLLENIINVATTFFFGKSEWAVKLTGTAKGET